jgi:hypothetical protein
MVAAPKTELTSYRDSRADKREELADKSTSDKAETTRQRGGQMWLTEERMFRTGVIFW